MRRILLYLGVAVLAASCGCESTTPETVGDPQFLSVVRTDREFNNDPSNFQFAIMADRTGGHRPGVFIDAVDKINLLQPEFVICVGDMIEGSTQDQARLDAERTEFDEIVGRLEMPFFYVPGNHDITNEFMADDYRRRYGRSYYHFVYRNVLFLCLNTEDPPATNFGSEQIAYAANALAENPDVRWTLLFMHKPMWLEGRGKGWDEIEKLLAGRPHTVFAGHHHTYLKDERGGADYLMLATTGGASGLAGPDHGQFDHIVWVTMTDQGPSIANLLLDGIHDKNVRTPETAALLSGIAGGRAFPRDAVLVEKADFTAARHPIRIINRAEVPMHFKMSFRPINTIVVEPQQAEFDIPPQAEMEVVVDLTAPEPIKIELAPPIVFDWTASYRIEGRARPVTARGEQRVMLERIQPCARRTRPVRIDGKLNDWKALPIICTQPAQIHFNPDSWSGPKDGSFRFGTAYDNQFLYIAIATTDDKVVAVPDSWPWFQDGVEVRLDARPDPERSRGRGEGEKENFLLIALRPCS